MLDDISHNLGIHALIAMHHDGAETRHIAHRVREFE
jgi:hypothetical protein